MCRSARFAALLTLALVSGCSADPRDSSSPSPSPTTHDIAQVFRVGERSLYLRCTGSGRPTLLLESGDSVSVTAMSRISTAFSDRHRVCGYDRANNGASGPAETPRTAEDVHDDLDGLIAAADLEPPFVLVGHSAGGFLVQSYARTRPDSVVGVLAMNPVPPYDLTVRSAFPAMTADERRAEEAYFHGGQGSGEHIDWAASGAQLASTPVPTMPLTMLISTIQQCDAVDDICGRTYAAYEQNMQAVTRQWAGGRFVQVAAGHEIYLDDFPTVERELTGLLERVAAG